jgi:ABC-type multidrug transport system permease subunit
MLQMDASLPTILKTRNNFYREQASLLYDPGAYSLASILVEIPWLALCILIGTSIAYFMVGLSSNAGVFFFHYLVAVLLGLTLVSLGHMVGAALPSFDVAQAVIGTAAPILFIFGGLFQAPSKMPEGSRWVTVIDPISYAFSALVSTHFYCEGGSASGCPSVNVPDPIQGLVLRDRYDYVRDTYEVYYENRWANLGYLTIFVLVFQFGAFMAVRYIRHIVR